MAIDDSVQPVDVDRPTNTPSESASANATQAPSSAVTEDDKVNKEPSNKKVKIKFIPAGICSEYTAEVKESTDHELDSDSNKVVISATPERETIQSKERRCIMCGNLTAVQCQQCKSAEYCGLDCQKKDWPVHKVLCKQYASFLEISPRPSPEQSIVFVFPHNFKYPSLQWANASNNLSVRELLAYPGEDSESISHETHYVFKRRGEPNWSLEYTLTIYYRSIFYGHAVNLSLEKLGKGKLKQELRGPVVVTSDRGDVTMADLRYIIQHLQIPPSLLAI